MKSRSTNKEPEERQKTYHSVLNRLMVGIADLPPAEFALVMATGIVSIAASLFDYRNLAKTLFYLNITAYFVLVVLVVIRIILYRKKFLSDVLDDRKNMGFLTFVAATCILGGQFVLFEKDHQSGTYFFAVGLAAWVILIYFLFARLIEKHDKPSIKAISGLWLLLTVATQAASILSTQLEGHLPFSREAVLFFSLTLFLCGCMFYIIVITLIMYRLMFCSLHAQDLSPTYWINMGADAITVLAGSTLILSAEKWQLLTDISPFLKGFTLLFWAFGTWWIPLMIILGIRRHFVKKIPLKYTPQYWAIVFPLGMYTVCTASLSRAFSLPFLMEISSVFVIIAIGAWAVVFIYMLYSIAFNAITRRRL